MPDLHEFYMKGEPGINSNHCDRIIFVFGEPVIGFRPQEFEILPKIGILEGTIQQWLSLFSGIGKSEVLKKLNINNNLAQGIISRSIIIFERTVRLPLKYSNMPNSIISTTDPNILYCIAMCFPSTPLSKSLTLNNNKKLEICLDNIEKFKRCEEMKLYKITSSNTKSSVASERRITAFSKRVGREYSIFQKFNEGIILDRNAIFDATPEVLAQHIARRLRGCTVLDACCGVGGNTIPLSQHCELVVSVELVHERLEIVKHNATIYGLYGRSRESVKIDDLDIVREEGSPNLSCHTRYKLPDSDNLYTFYDTESNIVFICGDILEFCRWYKSKQMKKANLDEKCVNSNGNIQYCKKRRRYIEGEDKVIYNKLENCNGLPQVFIDLPEFDWCFASPPWGGKKYSELEKFSLNYVEEINYSDFFISVSTISRNLALFLPRNTDIAEFCALLSLLDFEAMEIENIIDTRYEYIVGIVIYCVRSDMKRDWYFFGIGLDKITEAIKQQVKFMFEKFCDDIALIKSNVTISKYFEDIIEVLIKSYGISISKYFGLLYERLKYNNFDYTKKTFKRLARFTVTKDFNGLIAINLRKDLPLINKILDYIHFH
ncbi:hypothetical protein cand_007620 [Cryptosporidium andersoni]|uniref:Trimethylguanosine synthase n=1 Tax=Cryptosporidium andersoni TaxID=117008 RepID=A0A1J4MPB6_9CRYT|nr:hypothetical protein cand_007620 [Cryptosporidium andersoni]